MPVATTSSAAAPTEARSPSFTPISPDGYRPAQEIPSPIALAPLARPVPLKLRAERPDDRADPRGTHSSREDIATPTTLHQYINNKGSLLPRPRRHLRTRSYNDAEMRPPPSMHVTLAEGPVTLAPEALRTTTGAVSKYYTNNAALSSLRPNINSSAANPPKNTTANGSNNNTKKTPTSASNNNNNTTSLTASDSFGSAVTSLPTYALPNTSSMTSSASEWSAEDEASARAHVLSTVASATGTDVSSMDMLSSRSASPAPPATSNITTTTAATTRSVGTGWSRNTTRALSSLNGAGSILRKTASKHGSNTTHKQQQKRTHPARTHTHTSLVSHASHSHTHLKHSTSSGAGFNYRNNSNTKPQEWLSHPNLGNATNSNNNRCTCSSSVNQRSGTWTAIHRDTKSWNTNTNLNLNSRNNCPACRADTGGRTAFRATTITTTTTTTKNASGSGSTPLHHYNSSNNNYSNNSNPYRNSHASTATDNNKNNNIFRLLKKRLGWKMRK